MLLPFFLSLLLLLRQTLSAGVGIHATIVSRIHQYLPLEIQSDEYYPYLLAGSFFPDSFYSCGGSDLKNASEYLHWPPFLAQAVNYYKAQISSIEEPLKLKAFLYGIFTHQATDSSWHSIEMKQGLLPMLANMEFDGNIEEAHSYLDTAGDFLHLMKLNDISFYKTGYKVPNADNLIELMENVGFTIPISTLLSCSSLGETGLSSELRTRKLIGPLNAKTSPLLDDVLESYYLGGLQEITNSLIKCLPKFNSWFENGASKNPWDLCGSIIEHPLTDYTIAKLSMKENDDGDLVLTPWIPHGHFGHSISVANFLQEPSIAVGANYEETSGSVYVLPLSEFSSLYSNGLTRVQNPSNFSYPHRFGSKVLAYNLMGQEFLIVNEPGTSSIHIFSGNTKILTIVDSTSKSIYGSRGVKESYTSIFVSDLDDSGLQDIILGSPYNDFGGKSQRGKITILSGAKISLLLFASYPKEEIDVKHLIDLEFSLPSEFYLNNGYEQFGSSISADSEYIYVTSNGHGSIFAFSHDGELQHTIYKEEIDSFDSIRRNSKESERFGAHWIISGTYNDVNYLFVGAHRSDSLWRASIGAVYVYVVDDCNITFKTRLTVRSRNSFAKFGWFSVVDDGYIYISAPGYDFSGSIFRIKLDKIFKSRSKELIVDEIVLRNTQDVYTGFGESFAVFEDKLIVGEPQFGFTELFRDEIKLTGRVLIHNL